MHVEIQCWMSSQCILQVFPWLAGPQLVHCQWSEGRFGLFDWDYIASQQLINSSSYGEPLITKFNKSSGHSRWFLNFSRLENCTEYILRSHFTFGPLSLGKAQLYTKQLEIMLSFASHNFQLLQVQLFPNQTRIICVITYPTEVSSLLAT